MYTSSKRRVVLMLDILCLHVLKIFLFWLIGVVAFFWGGEGREGRGKKRGGEEKKEKGKKEGGGGEGEG